MINNGFHINGGFIHDSQAVDAIVEWEAPVITSIQRAAFGALRSNPGLVVSTATQDEWDSAVARQKEMIANVSKEV